MTGREALARQFLSLWLLYTHGANSWWLGEEAEHSSKVGHLTYFLLEASCEVGAVCFIVHWASSILMVFAHHQSLIHVLLRPLPSYQSTTAHLSTLLTIQAKPLPTALNNLCVNSSSFPSKSIVLCRLLPVPRLRGCSLLPVFRAISANSCHTC